MEERYHEQLGRVVERIERSLGRRLSLDALSLEAGLSKYHLHRVFRAMTGYPLAEYVRRRRISESLAELMGTSRPIIGIALDYGFEYEQSYIRAFRQSFGMSPGQCRCERPILEYTEKVDLSGITGVGEDAALLAPRLVMKPPTLICGVRHWINRPKNRAESTVARLADEFVRTERKRIAEPIYRGRYVGVSLPSPDPDNHWYIIGAELRGASSPGPPEGMEVFQTGRQRYREFVHILRVHPSKMSWDDLRPLYANVKQLWQPSAKDRAAPGWCLEYIDLDAAREDYGEFRLLIPVEAGKKEGDLS